MPARSSLRLLEEQRVPAAQVKRLLLPLAIEAEGTHAQMLNCSNLSRNAVGGVLALRRALARVPGARRTFMLTTSILPLLSSRAVLARILEPSILVALNYSSLCGPACSIPERTAKHDSVLNPPLACDPPTFQYECQSPYSTACIATVTNPFP